MNIVEERKEKAKKIIPLLKKEYPEARIELDQKNPLELLVATILSAQCTDKRVNLVTPSLFKKYKTARAYAEAPMAELEGMIRSTGFFRSKARSIQGAMKVISERHGGKVPATMEELTHLPGVGRKTANVILGNAFGIPGIVVDTHVKRIANRLGLTHQNDPEKIEQDLMPVIPQKEWTHFSHLLIFHGRRCCYARNPECPRCPVRKHCVYYATLRK